MKLHRLVEEALERIPGRWKLEMGGKHVRVMVDGKLAAILPKGPASDSDRRAQLNTRAQIRRAAERGHP